MSLASTSGRPVVLTLLGCLWPGNDASGPNQSFRAMAAALSDEFDFLVIARDRAFGAVGSATGSTGWREEAGFRIRYLPVSGGRALGLRSLLRATPHDMLVLNGFFDREFTIPALLFRKLGLLASRPTILSPRGEFSHGAPDISARRKRAWLTAARLGRLVSNVTMHGTSGAEVEDIARAATGAAYVALAPNLRPLLDPVAWCPPPDGRLRLAYIGRVSPKKNIDLAIAALAKVRAPVVFDIFGPTHERAYADRCVALCANLPPHVEVRWRAEIRNAAVPEVLAGTDLFLHPSASENFGHAIFEALSCGVPVLIGRHTPWQDLERDAAGYNLALDSPDRMAATIDIYAAKDAAARAAFRAGARARAERTARGSDAVGRLRGMFWDVLAVPERPATTDVQPRRECA